MLQDNCVVFVHLLDSKGNLLTSHDGLPAAGRRPTTTWTTSENLLDVHQFQVPTVSTADRVFVATGLYIQETGERLTLVGGSDSITIYDLELSRPE
ncbi:MAG TPA: hypothetical protein EYN64_02985 [Flavobacteriales bacterium]|nr:hypothetical protein [Flavobacteriales bacterium]